MNSLTDVRASYLAYVKPVRRFGIEQWRAVLTIDGREVWSCQRWSEAQARTECLRAMFRYRNSVNG